MRIKELLISMAAASMLVFGAGCGDDDSNGNGDDAGDGNGNEQEPPLTEIPPEAQNCSIIGNDAPAADCAESTDEVFRFRMSNIQIPPTSDLVGFNLDCYETTARNRYGCKKVDGPGGIDNALASLTNTLKTVGGIDLNDSIGEGVTDGSINLVLVVSGYDGDGDGNDDCVTVTLVDGETNERLVEPVKGIIKKDGDKLVLIVALDNLPLSIPFEDQSLDLDIRKTRLEFPINEDGSGFEGGVLGGSVVWDDNQGGGLQSIVRDLLASLADSSLDFETVAPIIKNMLDLHDPEIDADPNVCSAISLGLSIDGTAVEAPPIDDNDDDNDDGNP